MKVSAATNDPDYWANQFEYSPTVTIDGRAISDVISADDVAGLVEFYPSDERGELLRDESGNSFVVNQVRGKVEIIGKRIN